MKRSLRKLIDIPVKQYGYILFGVVFGALTYFSLMSNDLINHLDGIWHTSNFIAGDWEISLGRGLQRYADRARFGLVTSSYNSLLFLLLFLVADIYIIYYLRLSRFFAVTFIMLSVANPVVCESLSYSYMSINFALAYFFSIMAFSVMADSCDDEGHFAGIVLAAIFLAISMAFYQAYIGVYCILAIMYFCMNTELWESKKAVKGLGKAAIIFVMGGFFYFIIVKLLLLRADIGLSSYKGADSVGVLPIIMNLPRGIEECYSSFYAYFVEDSLQSHLEFADIAVRSVAFVYLIMICVMGAVAIKKMMIKNYIRQIFFVILVPVAAGSICLIAVGNAITSLMAMPIMIAVGLFPVMLGIEKYTSLKYLYKSVMIILVWYMTSTVVNDQIALKEGKNSTVTITHYMIQKMIDEDYPISEKPVAFVGRMAENPLFPSSTAYEMANGYAQFGKWSTEPRNNRATWIGITYNLCGSDIWVCDQWTYSDLIGMDEVKQMPVFPAEGSIAYIDDVIVVKVSEVY